MPAAAAAMAAASESSLTTAISAVARGVGDGPADAVPNPASSAPSTAPGPSATSIPALLPRFTGRQVQGLGAAGYTSEGYMRTNHIRPHQRQRKDIGWTRKGDSMGGRHRTGTELDRRNFSDVSSYDERKDVYLPDTRMCLLDTHATVTATVFGIPLTLAAAPDCMSLFR